MMRWVDAEQDAAGSVRRWDRAARAVIDYDPAGVEVARRPFAADEEAAAVAQDALDAARVAHEASRAAVRGILDDIDAQQARAQEVIDSPAASTEGRKAARATLRLAGAVKDLARFARGLA